MDLEELENLEEETRYPWNTGWEDTIPATLQNFYEIREELRACLRDEYHYGGMNYRRSIACNKRMLKLLNSIIESETGGKQ
tara:strand:- start:200 stop:442 length:243 start_codon:yes stop_codon:yes gene_type:complete